MPEFNYGEHVQKKLAARAKAINRLQYRLKDLVFIDDLALYYDSEIDSDFKYSIIKGNGQFLMDRVDVYFSIFFTSIRINELGIFLVNNDKMLLDKNAYLIKVEVFELFKTLLSNRNTNYKPEIYYEPDEVLVNSRFSFCKGPGHAWQGKSGKSDIELGELPCGLIVKERRWSNVGKDYDTVIYEVHDNKGNKMGLSEFWQCHLMVENGKRYLDEILKYNSINLILKNIEQ